MIVVTEAETYEDKLGDFIRMTATISKSQHLVACTNMEMESAIKGTTAH